MLKRYQAYKDSGVPWLGQVPEHWKVERGKRLFKKMARQVREIDEVITCFRDGKVTLRRNRRVRGFTESLKEIGYQGIRKGDLIIHAMDAFAGAIGVAECDGKGSPVYSVCEASAHANAQYYAWATREMARSNWILALATGIRERSTDFRFETFASQLLPIPPLREQTSIVRYLDHIDRRIRRCIRAKQRFLGLVAEEREALTYEVLRSRNTKQIRLGLLVDNPFRLVSREATRVYTPIGLFNRGRGIFHKEQTLGRYLGDSTFSWIEEGDLILSGQFAWEGAIATVGPQDANCICSHRYHILRTKPDLVNAFYLSSFFRTSLGHLLLNEHSRGAAGRNRPLNANTLLKEKVPVPSFSEQTRVGKLVVVEQHLTAAIGRMSDRLREYRDRLIADVVTGKLDVRDAAAALPAEAEEEPVDEIEAQVEADEEAEDAVLDAPEEAEA